MATAYYYGYRREYSDFDCLSEDTITFPVRPPLDRVIPRRTPMLVH